MEGSESGKSESIEKAPHSELHELSYAQRRLWILDQMEDAGTTYNIPMAFEIRGNLDFESFEKSFNYLVNRHESLRTTIVIQNGQPRQKIKELKDEIASKNKPSAPAAIYSSHLSITPSIPSLA